MKYKVGDSVRFTNNLETNHGPNVEYDRKIRKIVRVDNRNDYVYQLEELSRNWFKESELELAIKKISIDDLQFGDILTLRNDEKYVYASNRMYGEVENYYYDCDEIEDYYDNDLKHKSNNKYDIMKIEREGQIIYEREDVKEMTVEEVSRELGYEVKIVK